MAAIDLPDEIRDHVNGALLAGNPIILASVDEAESPGSPTAARPRCSRPISWDFGPATPRARPWRRSAPIRTWR
jgi:hypothetical protein